MEISEIIGRIQALRAIMPGLSISLEMKPDLVKNAMARDPEALKEIEYQLTLDALEKATDATSLKEALSQRWDRIRGSFLSYTQQPDDPVNKLCIEIAHMLYPLHDVDTNTLPKGEGPYFLLMPSLRSSYDAYAANIHDYQLHQFVLSDDESRFIPIQSCLDNLAVSYDDRLRHMVRHDAYDIILGNTAIPADATVAKRTLVMYLQGDTIHCAVRQEDGVVTHFVVPDEEIIDIDLARLKQLMNPPPISIPVSFRTTDNQYVCNFVNNGKPIRLHIDNFNPSASAQIKRMHTECHSLNTKLYMQGTTIICSCEDANKKVTSEVLAIEGMPADILKQLTDRLSEQTRYRLNNKTEKTILQSNSLVSRGYGQAKGEQEPFLSDAESDRVIHHSDMTLRYHDAINKLNEVRIHGEFLYPKLQRLCNQLMAGGEHQAHGGQAEYTHFGEVRTQIVAGALANTAIVDFFNYWNNRINSEIRKRNGTKYTLAREGRPAMCLNDILLRLEKADTQCVEVTSGFISIFLMDHQTDIVDPEFKKALKPLDDASLALQIELAKALCEDTYQCRIHRHQIPNILPAFLLLNQDNPTAFSELTGEPNIVFLLIKHYPFLAAKLPDILRDLNLSVKQAYLNAQDASGETPLMIACRAEDPSVAHYLIQAGADVNQPNDEGNTLLMLAIKDNRMDTLSTLLDGNADITLRNSQNESVLTMAMNHTNPKITNLLLLKAMRRPIDTQNSLLPNAEHPSTPILSYLIDTHPGIFSSIYFNYNTPIERTYLNACRTYVLHLTKNIQKNPEDTLAKQKRNIVLNAMQTLLLVAPDKTNPIENFKKTLTDGMPTLSTRRDKAFVTFLKALLVVASGLLSLVTLGSFDNIRPSAYEHFFGAKATDGNKLLTDVGIDVSDESNGPQAS